MRVKRPRDRYAGNGAAIGLTGSCVTARLHPLPREGLAGEERGNRDHRWTAHKAENNTHTAVGGC
jgi:hypothetical protein